MLRDFARLYDRLDRTTSTDAKVAALVEYFRAADAADAAWALFFISGNRFKRLLPGKLLWLWCSEVTGVPEWLMGESYSAVGDTAETITLLLEATPDRAALPEPAGESRAGGEQLSLGDLFAEAGAEGGAESGAEPSDAAALPLRVWSEERLGTLAGLPPARQRALVTRWWSELSGTELFVLNKMVTGALRVGVSQTLVVRALAEVAGAEPAGVAHRMMGDWRPTPEFFRGLLAPGGGASDASRPYPFFLASPILAESSTDPGAELEVLRREFGDPGEWLVEWKYDGIRAQLIRRGGRVFLWSRGDENLTERFPEIVEGAARLPDGCVLDGEVLAWRGGAPLPFGVLQRRIQRKALSAKVLREAPAAFVAYDVLEVDGEDVRGRTQTERRALLERAVGDGGAASGPILVSPLVEHPTWETLAAARAESRGRGVEGLMLKRKTSVYQAGRRRGDWWKWKIEPLTVDCVLLYAQPGSGRRASLLTDCTFALWTGPERGEGELAPFAKAYSGLSDEEIRTLDRWIRQHTVERFGPVRRVEPVQVFELAFEDVRESDRHKVGLAVRFPRIKRWRTDKKPEEADTLEDVRKLIRSE